MLIFNTLTRRLEELMPRDGRRLKIFVCGPTVYDYIHIGNARTFVFFDAAVKYLRYRGYSVFYLQNITDLDDKIIRRGKETSTEPSV
ncbi:MAG: cysteine--tRNA ligase, partial [Candidatus Thermoplasmatota archaeon]|nr:cysteine--tRNA ligase [Candidatus Thermoplasmatota archaeon]